MAITQLSDSGFNGTKYGDIMAGNTWMEPIATQLLTTSAASVTFSNIPQGYTHLQLRLFAYNTSGADGYVETYLEFNGDSGSNYARHLLRGDGSAAGAFNAVSQTSIRLDNIGTASKPAGAGVLDILDYTNQNKYKTVRALMGYDQNGSGYINLNSGLWMNTSPITSLKITCGNASFNTNSRFSLYGLRG